MTAPASRLAGRRDALAPRIQAAADEIVARGAHGVAIQLRVPGLVAPMAAASGCADPARGRPMQGQELFAIASQSKIFTAALVHLLIREGLFSFDDPVARFVPDLPAVDPSATIDQFLNHTSGIGNFIHALTTLAEPWPQMSYCDLMALARMHGRQSRPGARFDYNNTDVVVLARLCEAVTETPRDVLLRERIFEPLKMTDTAVGPGDTDRRSRFAKGYYVPQASGDGRPVDVSSVPDFSLAGAAGDITSSLGDLMRWADSLLAPASPIGISAADLSANRVDSGAAEIPWFMPRTYGRGAEGWLWGGRLCWGHRGSFFGYHSGTFVEPVSGTAMSMFLTMTTVGSFMQFINVQAHGYMSFMADCMTAAIDMAELP